MYSRYEIAELLGYDCNPTYPDEADEKIDRLLAVYAKRGLNAMANEAAVILREPHTEPADSKVAHEYCCDELKKQDEYFVEDDDPRKWNVLGCCKHCHVLTGVRFCPFCGTEWDKRDDD